MLKFLGVVLTAAGCAGLGMEKAAALRRQVRALEEVIQGLTLLENELLLRCDSLPRVMEVLSQRSAGTARTLFFACAAGLERLDEVAFAQTWEESVDGLEQLCPRGKELLRPLGGCLGRYESGAQCRAAEAVRGQLEELRERTWQDCCRLGRVYQAVGLAGGGFLMILLL